jgi:hypothetical protein
MIPKSSLDIELTANNTTQTNRTYKIINGNVRGFIDGLDAVKQAVYKVLNTEKYEYPIYDFDYGIELENLIGKDRTYVQIELKRRIKECLLQDERIADVSNFRFESKGDSLLCTFDVRSIYGDFTVPREVNV